MVAYAELHCLSNFTFLRGASHPEELVAQARKLGYTALAITDESSVAGVVRAHTAAKTYGLRLIIGSEVRLEDGLRLVLLAMDREGYGNLSSLITQSRRKTKKGKYVLERADLESGLRGCLALLVPEFSQTCLQSCRQSAHWLAEAFPRCAWIAAELFLNGRDHQHLQALELLGEQTGLPLVAAGDVHMHLRERRPLQDTLTAIRLGTSVTALGQITHTNAERHLRSLEQLARIYPQALLAETLDIARRCSFSLDELRYEYPQELVPAGETSTSYLRKLTVEGIEQRWPNGVASEVRTQIDHELRLIEDLKYEPFFLTVHDLVRFARGRGILCQGRGSAANSAVCFCLGITEVDPARMEMLFERFISKERNEPPDIDVDFEHERREEVIQYIYEKYGRDRAAITATVITYRPKSAIRDVGKALGMDLEQVDRLAKNIYWWDGKRVDPERLREVGFEPDTPLIKRLMALVTALMGFPRHLSQHVGGFVISHGALSRLVPIENAAMPERTVIQWDKDDLDALGLLKVDCLSLGMLTAIHKAFDLLMKLRGRPYSMASVPADDPATYAMIQKADTVGVFQIESRAQMAMLPRLKPASYYDLVIEVAIIRPGPIQGEMVHPYLRRREGLEPVTYPSEAVRGVLARTLGVPLFQEQVIKLAMVAAGFSPGEADKLRRSMASWRRNGGLEPFEQRLVEGMSKRGYSKQFARQIFQQILGFGEYGFPESHAASFALLAYVSAWLKCDEPAAFTCALLNSLPMGFYAPAQLVQDAKRHGVEVRAVDVLISDWDCTLEGPFTSAALTPTPLPEGEGLIEGSLLPWGEGQAGSCSLQYLHSRHSWRSDEGRVLQPTMRLGLRMLKGLSSASAQRIVSARDECVFRDVQDLARRAQLNRKDLEALAAGDALAGLAGNRHQSRWQVLGVEEPSPAFQDPHFSEALPILKRPSEGQNVAADYASLGLTLRRHPLALIREELDKRRFITAAGIGKLAHGQTVRTAGLVITRQRPGTATGVVFVTLEDETGHINLIVWNSLVESQRRELLSARLLGVNGEVQREGEVLYVIAKQLEDHSLLLGSLSNHSRDFH